MRRLEEMLSQHLGREPSLAVSHKPESPASTVSAGEPETEDTTIQWSVFDEIREMQEATDSDLFGELVVMYMTSSKEWLDKLADAIAARNAERARIAAHGLQSGSGLVGAHRLVRLCRALEDHARAGDLATAEQANQRIRVEHGRVVAGLKQKLAVEEERNAV
jgi:HPt (histidine-containing phosphotransfer) domain-containing protein